MMPNDETKAALFCLNPFSSTHTRLVIRETAIFDNLSYDKIETVLVSPEDEDRKNEGGMRIQKHLKKSLPDMPLITVVTVVFNDEKYLEDTILSVLSQSYDNVEYIIIDGGSTDGTVDIIRRYDKRVDYWLSEKDEGIYNAMNKGLEAAKGEWIIFMNSGDKFYHANVIRDVFNHVSVNTDVIYGQYLVDYGNEDTRKGFKGKLEQLWKGIMITSHQAMFIRSALMKVCRFDCEFKSAGDLELVSNLYSIGCSFGYIPEIISVVSAGGLSDVNRHDSYRESSKIAERYFKEKPFRIYFFFKYIDLYLRATAKKIIPSYIVKRLQTRNR